MKKKNTPFLDFYNRCIETGRIPEYIPRNLYEGEVTLYRVSPVNNDEIKATNDIWHNDKDKFTIIRQFAILLLAANNNEL